MSDVQMAMAADHAMGTAIAQQLGQEHVEQQMRSVPVPDKPDASDGGNAAPNALERDWRGLGRDTAYFLGYQTVFAGVFGGFWYAASLSGLYEFGIEALFERPSYQVLIVSPVAGMLVGALLFAPLREHIQGKSEQRWYEHLTLTVTDPLGAANSLFNEWLGLEADIQVQLRAPAFAPHAPFDKPTARCLNRPQEQHRWSPGIGIEFVFEDKKRSAPSIRQK